MEDHKLRVFCAVAETKSFSKASELIHLTQPAVSLQVQAMEELYETRLFDRSGNTINLTPAGEILYKRAKEILAESEAMSGPLSTVVFKSYAAFWWKDKTMASEVADLIEKSAAGASWGRSIHILRAFARGEYEPSAALEFSQLTSPRVGQRHRCMMHERAVEYFALWDKKELALQHIEGAARLAAFTSLLWMDRCPILDSVRDEPRFAEARAVVAARVVDLWG